VIAVAFLPIFVLVDQEGRLFKPLAYSKNLAMAIAALLAITLDPAMRMLFTRMDPLTFRPRWLARLATTVFVGTYYAEERHPISRAIFGHDPAADSCSASEDRFALAVAAACLFPLGRVHAAP
jgi:Cu(I)/Ag(I) efflux system membrane protein CusA/SilA